MTNKKTFGLQWHITNQCDQRCEHCYIYEGKDKSLTKDLPLDTLNEILKNFIKTCIKMDKHPFVAVTGGDPLLYEKIWEFLQLLNENGVKFSILGNPFHLDYDVAKELKSLGCTNYQMSLDGLKTTHDLIRKPGSYEATLEKVECLKKADLRATIMTTVSKTNMSEIPELVDVVVKHGVDNFAFARYCPSEEDISIIPTSEEYHKFLDKMWRKFEQYKDCSTRFSLKDHLWKLYLFEKGLFDIADIENPENLILDGCHCGISHMTVLADGTVYACRRSETPVGRVPEELLYDIFHSKQMDEYRKYDNFEACSKCELLNFCRGCPSVSKCVTGNFYSKDPQCWKNIIK